MPYDLLAVVAGWISTTIVVICSYARVEHRITRLETLVEILIQKEK